MNPVIRTATPEDVPVLRAVMEAAIAELQRGFLDAGTIEASRAVMGLDTTLIADGTYYIVECGGAVAGCGGWSRRATLFGGNHTTGRSDALLDPQVDPARFRAMYTHPDFARRGVGSRILAHSEAAARAEGFTSGVLMATLAGIPLYERCGWQRGEPYAAETPDGRRVPMLKMRKRLA
ncbi:GNAT family N-acetyltransferase [Acidomonas methanolica]|uniref:N-acetyltransferase GCN5 n=1 Tax=Acidomonas methanolica NBRC 104435 TaxID=1231351 RepID=A0A023D2S4_ACIMT|nr:GNAT family N-acetyltransferase [Acidomonas methanolica]MBU2654181.1 GNAT family N-acetyltransferase [Acidomonas methanolica]TCS30589.1 N-acetylglutamate synthase-like GNAT family acetyltransferase [Acidomonas methanolica]GAJ28369.1 N-acetyltransferase GCN5 [Acidomonas methanolica NBRC 104435]GBQ46334.1 acetyltransferase family protein [Acidomonas methanolica]GEK98853.1 acetyltransferase [Acidomonas methanolica NBRC 104435]